MKPDAPHSALHRYPAPLMSPFTSVHLQLYVDRARLDEKQPGGFDLLKGLVDVGDIVGATGTLKRTEKGELSVVTTGLQVRRAFT